MEAASNEAKALILADQASKIRDAANSMNKFQPNLLQFKQDEVKMSECQADPGKEGCDKFGFGSKFGLAQNSIQIGGFNRATSGSSTADDNLGDNNDDGDSSNDDTNRDDLASVTGSTIGGSNKGGGIVDKIAGAKIKSGGSINSQKEGVGGSISASADGLGGGGGGGLAARAGSLGSSRKGGFKYSGGGNNFGYSGGNGGVQAAKTKSSNPFAALLGKKKDSSKGGKVTNFGRKPAALGKKDNDLWGMISDRYGAVSKSKRLLIYVEN